MLPAFPNEFLNMNAWINAHASELSNPTNGTLSPVSAINTALNLAMPAILSPFFGGQSLFVSSVQMYIEIINPRIEFLAGTTSVHVIQNTGRYTGTSLQTFDVPHVDMSIVNTVSISSTSTINNNFTWYGLQRTIADGSSGFLFTGNFVFDTVPLMIFDNATGLNSGNNLDTTIRTTSETPITQGLMIPSLGYNFNPFYLTIPIFEFDGLGRNTATPVPFVLRVTQDNVVITANFNLDARSSYPNGIVVPLKNQLSIPTSVSTSIVTPTNTITSPPFLRGTLWTNVTLICMLNNVNNVVVRTRVNDNGGLAVRIFGTGVTIDPLFTPNNMAVMSPITFAPLKSVNFQRITTATDSIQPNSMSYTIFQPTPNIVTFTQRPPQELVQSFNMLQQFNQNNATITVFAHSRGVSGLNPRSIFAQPSIFNYGQRPAGRVVPFVNTYNFATPSVYNDPFAYMNVTFTQNMVLNSLDFGYVFPIFMPESNVTIAGYGLNPSSLTNTLTFTITVTSIPRTVGEPVITYGRVQFVGRPNTGTGYRAMHDNVENQNSSNDGTLLSIPFTTTAMTPLPTFINSFTPSVAGSNFTFNVGDQVRIEFGFGQSGGFYRGTSIDTNQFIGMMLGGTGMQEMLGALMCTPNGNTISPANIWFSTSTNTIAANTHTVQTESFTFNAPTIIHGFRLTSFVLTGVTATQMLRSNIYRNETIIFQVYFLFNPSRFDGTVGTAPLYIPFSYAEFARYAAIDSNSNDVSRIIPSSIVFTGPQHPIFNAGDAFRMEISVISPATPRAALNSFPLQYQGNATTNGTIGGRLSGISLNVPTITLQPNLPVTPVFSFGTNTRRIPIPAPTSNSNGAFDYTVSSQAINPVNGSVMTTPPGVSVNVVGNNELVTSTFGVFQSRVSMQAWQRSSTNFTRGSATFPNIDLINTGQARAALSTPNPSNGIVNTTSPFASFSAFIPFNATLLGFSFQFFGGYEPNVATMNVAMNVNIMRQNDQVGNLNITFTQNTSSIDGTMIYIPFGPSIINPTFVNNLTYTGTLVLVRPGDLVTVSINGVNGVNVNMRARQRNAIGGGGFGVGGFTPNWSLMGSLLFSDITSEIQTVSTSNNFTSGNNQVTVNAANATTLFQTTNINGDFAPRDIMLIDFSIPNIVLTGAPPTLENPHRITFTLQVSDNTSSSLINPAVTVVYSNTMTICLIRSNVDVVRIPFDMPLPGNAFSREAPDSGYYIESLEPFFNPNYFAPNVTTFSYPRIYQTRGVMPFTGFSCTVWVNSSRQFVIQDASNNLGPNRLSQLRYIQVS
jgi:hypothetical protein